MDNLENFVQCGDCEQFTRAKWHKSVDSEEAEQHGGYCKLLPAVLRMDNTQIFLVDTLYVQDSFGCSLGRIEAKQE